ncbi:MAG: hypothetical protein AAF184_04575 [Pseudomonadota bacterium]
MSFRFAVLCLVVLLGTIACSPAEDETDTGWQQALTRAQALSDAGDHEGAQFVLRRAIADAPQQEPTLHLALARVALARGRSDLALISAEDASQAGATADTVALLRAEVYYADGDLLSLSAMAKGPALAPSTNVMLRYFEGRALAESPYASTDRVFEHYFALIRDIEALDPTTRTDLANGEVDQTLAQLRTTNEAVERAWVHLRCADRPATAPSVWQATTISGERRVLHVGPREAYTTIAAAATAARDGDVVEIAAGDYPGDVAIWTQNGLLIRGTGGRPHVRGAGRRVDGRDVWLFKGDDIVIENVEISGARSPSYHNGASIRHIGKHLTLRHVFLHDSENGLLTGNRHPDSRILIEHSEFARNGYGDGLTHNVYVGKIAELIMRYSYSHDSHVGHLVKSRAARTQIWYNRLTDEQGDSSYLIDTPNGGEVTVMGNVLEQNTKAHNQFAISYAGEGLRGETHSLQLVNNSLYNRTYNGVLAHLHTRTRTWAVNNVAVGAPVGLVDTEYVTYVAREANLLAVDHGLRDPANFDFALTRTSPAIDSGEAHEVLPTLEYVHPVAYRPRPTIDRIDIGAYEGCLGALTTQLSSPAR